MKNCQMNRKTRMALACCLFLLTPPMAAAEPDNVPADARQLVVMPDAARAIMRSDMLDHLAALNEITGYLAEKNLEAAAETAEQRIGNSAIGKHAAMARGQGPGRFMPDAMRQLGWGMHSAASEFALVVKQGDQASTYAALQKIMSSCVACHMSFRTR